MGAAILVLCGIIVILLASNVFLVVSRHMLALRLKQAHMMSLHRIEHAMMSNPMKVPASLVVATIETLRNEANKVFE